MPGLRRPWSACEETGCSSSGALREKCCDHGDRQGRASSARIWSTRCSFCARDIVPGSRSSALVRIASRTCTQSAGRTSCVCSDAQGGACMHCLVRLEGLDSPVCKRCAQVREVSLWQHSSLARWPGIACLHRYRYRQPVGCKCGNTWQHWRTSLATHCGCRQQDITLPHKRKPRLETCVSRCRAVDEYCALLPSARYASSQEFELHRKSCHRCLAC